jgi:hypothetical protein
LARSAVSRHLERLILAAGACALAASSFLPMVGRPARWKVPDCGWTCYSPLPPGWRLQSVSGAAPWDTRPALAVLLVAVAALALVVGLVVEQAVVRRVVAGAVVVTTGLLVAHTAHLSDHAVRHHQLLSTTPWLALGVAGGLVAALALAQRGT